MNKVRNQLRIIGGRWRGRHIHFPDDPQLRPTANRIRETLFNWLQFELSGKHCLDLFAGSGACGIEALSRGAGSVVFVESNLTTAGMIEASLAALKAANYQVTVADALQWLCAPTAGEVVTFDIVFLDPPYAADLENKSLSLLIDNHRLAPGGLVYLETDKPQERIQWPHSLQVIKSKRAGDVNYFLARLEME